MNFLKILFFFFLTLVSSVSQAKPRNLVPLLPPRENASTPPLAAASLNTKRTPRSARNAWGFEVGSLGVANKTSSDVLGMQLLFGARVNSIVSLNNRFFLKPSLGYFIKPESEGDVSITQHLVEAGLGTHYALLMRSGLMWHLGLSQRLDYLFTRISVPTSAANTPATFRYRIGATSGLRVKMGESSDFTIDLEGGITPFEGLRVQSSFSTGLVFFFD